MIFIQVYSKIKFYARYESAEDKDDRNDTFDYCGFGSTLWSAFPPSVDFWILVFQTNPRNTRNTRNGMIFSKIDADFESIISFSTIIL